MKTTEKFKDKLAKLKVEKRKACKPIKDDNYGKTTNNTKMKKIKEGFKAERRAIKRGEKNLVKKEMELEIQKTLKPKKNKKIEKGIVEMFPFNYFKKKEEVVNN